MFYFTIFTIYLFMNHLLLDFDNLIVDSSLHFILLLFFLRIIEIVFLPTFHFLFCFSFFVFRFSFLFHFISVVDSFLIKLINKLTSDLGNVQLSIESNYFFLENRQPVQKGSMRSSGLT
jgi:hypothetical protein